MLDEATRLFLRVAVATFAPFFIEICFLPIFGLGSVGLGVCVGLAGVAVLPLPRLVRVLLACLYAPAMSYFLLKCILVFAAVFYNHYL